MEIRKGIANSVQHSSRMDLQRQGAIQVTKIVYNACYGGFGLSDEAVEMYLDLKGFKYTKTPDIWGANFVVEGWEEFYYRDIERDDPTLVQVVETLGEKANGMCANLSIEDLPKGTLYRITEYDGYESIETQEDLDWRVA
jgi:hypothetical protein